MPALATTDFVRSFAQRKDDAFREVVKVTSHGRVIGGCLSAPIGCGGHMVPLRRS